MVSIGYISSSSHPAAIPEALLLRTRKSGVPSHAIIHGTLCAPCAHNASSDGFLPGLRKGRKRRMARLWIIGDFCD
ncbi:unnamed protein product [Lasius platythorax]|uniref:Uncharacterized protein n=1 Tax=Lasius platythorax TaxID=488582 RepID=A0AAV2NZ14_9HYME